MRTLIDGTWKLGVQLKTSGGSDSCLLAFCVFGIAFYRKNHPSKGVQYCEDTSKGVQFVKFNSVSRTPPAKHTPFNNCLPNLLVTQAITTFCHLGCQNISQFHSLSMLLRCSSHIFHLYYCSSLLRLPPWHRLTLTHLLQSS